MKKSNDYKYYIKTPDYINVDMEDFLEMHYAGLSEGEIAKELGISHGYLRKIKNDLDRNH